MIELRPIKQRAAFAFVAEVHRHLPPPRGDVIRVAAYDGDRLVGVATAGRPVARHLDDGRTLEVLRVAALPEAPHGGGHALCIPSRLYAAIRRAGFALGYQRIVTYTLAGESGASLRAAGWRLDGETDGGEWDRADRPRQPVLFAGPKLRWSVSAGSSGTSRAVPGASSS